MLAAFFRFGNADVYTSGIIVPQVNTAEEAATVVAHSKFPPQGLRGQGSAFPGIAHGVDIHTYVKTANETLITCLQIETKAGLENVDAICAVPGVGEFQKRKNVAWNLSG
jgi:4-hydroxy-2-oxoheptanedioate aldolase